MGAPLGKNQLEKSDPNSGPENKDIPEEKVWGRKQPKATVSMDQSTILGREAINPKRNQNF